MEVIQEMSKRVEDKFSSRKYGNQLRHREKLKKEGKCLNCGKDAKGKTYCEPCSKEVYKKLKDKLEQRREAGLCIKCKKPVDGSESACKDCAEKIRKHRQEWDKKHPDRRLKPNRPTDYTGPGKQDKVKWGTDEFSDLENQINPKTGKPYTRQYIWQKRMSKRGKCSMCGEPAVLWGRCQKHAILQVMRKHGITSMDDPKIQKWMTKHGFQPDYMIESP